MIACLLLSTLTLCTCRCNADGFALFCLMCHSANRTQFEYCKLDMLDGNEYQDPNQLKKHKDIEPREGQTLWLVTNHPASPKRSPWILTLR